MNASNAQDQKKHFLSSDQRPAIGAALVCFTFVLSRFFCLGAPFATGGGSPTSRKPLRYIQLRLCQFLDVEYHGNLVDYPGPICGCHPHHSRKFAAAGPDFLAGKPYPDHPENSLVVPFSAHLDGVRAFSSILGPGLALAQPGQRTGHRAKAHPMVRVYRCSGGDTLDHTGQLCSFEGLQYVSAKRPALYFAGRRNNPDPFSFSHPPILSNIPKL